MAMASPTNTRHAPIVAGFSPVTGATEPVEFGVTASEVTGAPLVVAVVRSSHESPGGTVADLQSDLARRGLAVDVREYRDVSAGAGLCSVVKQLDPELVVVGTTHRGAAGSALL